MTTFDHSAKMPFDMPPQMGWQPPSSANRLELAFGFAVNGEKGLGDATGGHLTFTPQARTNPNRYSARVTADTGEIWTYGQSDFEFGSEQAGIIIDRVDPRGKAMMAAISHGMRLKVDILVDGKIDQSDTFDPSNTIERDKLISYARHLVETRDPRVCKAI